MDPASNELSRESWSGNVAAKDQVWKVNDHKADKSGTHRTIYWVKKKGKKEDGTVKGEKWETSTRYIGDWSGNLKNGYGVQIYPNGDKYEGMWDHGHRSGQGTYWKFDHNKLRREYTGEWCDGVREGRGTYFYKNNDRYDGYWGNGMRHGEGRMIYANGDIYEGQWYQDKKNGYGVLTKRNGDHYEGQWVNDMREGQGSYYYSAKGKLFVGEWVEDQPTSGISTEVEDEELLARIPKKKYFTDPYFQPSIPELALNNPALVLEEALERVKKQRAEYRAQYIPVEDMFTPHEIADLQKAFDAVAQGEDAVDLLRLKALFNEMDIYPPDEVIEELVRKCSPDQEEISEVNFEMFIRAVALLLEENIGKVNKEEIYAEEQEEEYYPEEDEEEGIQGNY